MGKGMPPTKSTSDWLSPTDASALTPFSKGYIGKLSRRKKIRTKAAGKNRLLYNKADIVKFVKAHAKKVMRANAKKAKKATKATKKRAAKVTQGGVTKWIGIADATKLSGLTASGVQYAARKGHIRRKKTSKGIRYASDDVVSYVRTNHGPTAKPKGETKPAFEQLQMSARMAPKQAQTAVQKARWVFDGLSMGAIVSDGEALSLLRHIFYEGTD